MKEMSWSERRAFEYVQENKLFAEVNALMKMYNINLETACGMVYDAHTMDLAEYLATYAE